MTSLKSISQAGIWMDHSNAYIIEHDSKSNQVRLLQSSYKSRVRLPGEGSDSTQLGNYRSTNNESHKHNRKQDEVISYYKKLDKELRQYKEILIFGPTTAHKEFQNYLLREKKYAGRRIVVTDSDYISENQMIAVVKNFFSMPKQKA